MRRLLLAGAALLLGLAGTAGGAAPPATTTPGRLTVGVNLPSEGFQVGAVRGTQVVVARGLEIDLAKLLARRLGLERAVFVQSRFDRLFSAGAKPWDLAIAEITIRDDRERTADFSVPYMTVDQGVLLAQTVSPTPRTIAGLRSLRLCALAKSTGATLVAERIQPTTPARSVGNVAHLMLDLQTGRCQAVVYDAPALGTLKSRAPARFGPFAGIVETGEQYGIALPQGSALRGRVNAALKALLADGSIDRLQKKWLTTDVDELPVLR
ncbi:MAG TPA: ABC transporter substrate-binding protein [Gaiellaceae bacterium]|jgi:polar amino acid transport system substrate-binding protein